MASAGDTDFLPVSFLSGPLAKLASGSFPDPVAEHRGYGEQTGSVFHVRLSFEQAFPSLFLTGIESS
jgi:hypothetical protein